MTRFRVLSAGWEYGHGWEVYDGMKPTGDVFATVELAQAYADYRYRRAEERAAAPVSARQAKLDEIAASFAAAVA